jgi:hypothetical protein
MVQKWLIAMSAAVVGLGAAQTTPPPVRVAEERAVHYLAAEVPRWRRDHPCYSCHNNGDAARALIAASARGFGVGDALADTLQWIATPERWDANESRGGSEDLPLARIQFASALAAMAAGGRASPAALDQAAARVISHQQADGSWRLSETQLLGGATFYGTALATTMARASAKLARTSEAPVAVRKADIWLRTAPIASVLDASSVAIGLERDIDPAAAAQRGRALAVLKRGQGSDGGWGPYVTSQSEPFDTALAILALSTARPIGDPLLIPLTTLEIDRAIANGRAYLVESQSADGSWPETTRPPGGESYAQRISTTAWALLALLED